MEYKKIKLTMDDIADFNDEILSSNNFVDKVTEELNTKLHDILEEKGYCTEKDLFGYGRTDIGWVKMKEDK